MMESSRMEEGWVCHECGSYNVSARTACRNCDHTRCDLRSVPSDEGESESDDGAPPPESV